MKARKLLAVLALVSLRSAAACAQVCGNAYEPDVAYGAPPPVSAPSYAAVNPCAPYAWCGPRDAAGNPVYFVPGYTAYPAYPAYPDVSAFGAAAAVIEATRPNVNGWTGTVETRPYALDGIFILQ